MTPILQTRNIFDSVISVRDHLVNEALTLSMAYVDERFLRLTEEGQYDFIIEMFMPWYFGFYASWFAVEESVRSKLLLIGYEALLADTPATLKTTLRFIDELRTDAQVRQAIEQARTTNTRKNKAVQGRGNALLTPRQKDKIREYRKYYDHLDFAMIGL